MKSPIPLTVFVIDDEASMRKSLSWLLKFRDYQVETFASAELFLESYSPEHYGCLILDIRIEGGMSGIELQERLLQQNCQLPIIMISGHTDLPTAIHTMRTGAMHFLEKPLKAPQLLATIELALEQERERWAKTSENSEKMCRWNQLTPREKEILEKVVAGSSSREIADELQVSPRTIDSHRTQIMRKIDVQNVPQLMQFWFTLHPKHE